MSWVEKLKNLEAFKGSRLFDEPLAKHTYFKIGGPAKALVFPESVEDLRVIAQFLKSEKIPFTLIGLGSNLLVRDEGFSGIVVKTTKLPTNVSGEEGGVRIGAGVPVATFLRRAAQEGWDGFEIISGIPGTLGGIIAMNGGTHLGEAADLLLEVRTFNFEKPDSPLQTYAGAELRFSYRKNHFLHPGEIVIDSLWKKNLGVPEKIREKLDGLFRRRKETQPLEFPSCGSVFKNPKESGLRAWEVIDRLGLRGHRIGNAQFAEKHPNWILNLGEASANDALALIQLAKKRAKTELGVHLVEEVRILPE